MVCLPIHCFQRHVACGHFKGKGFAGAIVFLCPAAIRRFGFGICRLPLLELFSDIIALSKLNGHLGARQIDAGGFAGVAALVHDGAAGHGKVVQLLVISFQGHIACGHGKGEFFAGLPVLRRLHHLGTVVRKRPAVELMVRIEEGVRRFHRDGFTFQRPAALLVVYENRAAAISHRHIVNRFVLGFQRHVACRHGKAKARLALPIIGQVCGFRAAERPLLELILDTRAPGKRNGDQLARLHDHLGYAGGCTVHDGAALHGEVVQLHVISGQGHIACGHFKGKGFAGAIVCRCPAAIRLCGCSAGIRPLLELFSDITALGKHNGHLGARQIVAGVAVSVHDGAAGHGEVVQLLVISGQGHVALRHFKGKGFAVSPIRVNLYDVLAAGPLLELLCIRVRRGRNGHHFTGIEAGIADAICLGGDTFRQGKGVKGVGFDAQIRRCAADGFAGMELCAILCSPIEIAIARRRRIGDAFRRLAAGATVDDLYLIGIFNGRIAGNDRRRSLASCYGNAAAPFYIQSAENRRAAAVGNGNGSGGVNACTTLHKGRTAALIAGNDHLTGAVFHGEFFIGHLTIRVAQLHFAGAGQGDIAADGR